MRQTSTGDLLRVESVVKRYPGVLALDHVSIHVRRGTIHGLLGENGAGKSTLVSLIAGLATPTEGRIMLDGEAVQGQDVRRMEARGVFLVPQEPRIVELLSVADNLMLGRWPVRRGWPGMIDTRALRTNAARVLAGTGFDPRMPARCLSAVDKRRLNILRALSSGGRLLILDEPTAALTLDDRRKLFDFMRQLKAAGTSFVFISHYNEEILELCDAVSVLRNGRLAGERAGLDSVSPQALSELVTGRDVVLFHRSHQPQAVAGEGWRIEGWRIEGWRARGVEIDRFEIAPGEIVGLVGLPGSGAKEFARTLFGLPPAQAGVIRRAGRSVARADHPQAALAAGIAYLSDDRLRDGFVGLQSMGHNIAMSSLSMLSVAGVMHPARERRLVDALRTRWRLTASPTVMTATLSGGNQQKVCLARTLATGPRLLILDEPTRGIDIGVKEEVHRLLDALTHQGLSLIVVTSDLDELVRLADRICVFAGGRIRSEHTGDELHQNTILAAAFGTTAVR